MEPAYKSGDCVVTFNWGRFNAGDVVVLNVLTSLRAERSNLNKRLPRNSSDNLGVPRNDKKMYWIKRVDRLDGNQVFVSGDNTKSSSKIGSVGLNQIVGKVILKY